MDDKLHHHNFLCGPYKWLYFYFFWCRERDSMGMTLLAPLLFLLVGKGLSRAIREAKNQTMIQSIQIS